MLSVCFVRIAKDKAERKSRGGTLASSLSVEGYAPSGMSAQLAAEMENAERDERRAAAGVPLPAIKTAAAAPAQPPGEAVDAAIASISKYKVGGDGAKCLKLLELFLKNTHEKPDEAKYRSINMESNAFKTKVPFRPRSPLTLPSSLGSAQPCVPFERQGAGLSGRCGSPQGRRLHQGGGLTRAQR